MRINEIAKEYGKSSKELILLLESQGIMGKTHSNGLTDREEKLVRELMEGGKPKAPVKPKAELVQKPKPKEAPAKEESPEPVKAQEKDGEREAARQAAQEKAQKTEPAAADAAAKPKKKIIVLSNPQGNTNVRPAVQRGQDRNRQGNAPAGRPGVRTPYHPIRSSIKAADPNSEEFLKKYSAAPATKPEAPVKQRDAAPQADVREAEAPARSQGAERSGARAETTVITVNAQEKGGNVAAEKKPQEQKRERRPERNDRNTGARPQSQGGQLQNRQGAPSRDRNGQAAPAPSDRSGNGRPGDRGQRGNAPQGNRSFGPGNQGGGKGQGKAVDKRRQVQDKDKKKKNLTIEDADPKTRTKKAGRFIKPEKKEEPVEEQIKVITIPETLTIKELADKMKLVPSVIIKKLFLQGKIATVNTELSFEEAENIAIEYEIMCEKEVPVDVIAELLKEEEEDESLLTERPPVVCVMGHVDHGKTSLLDAVRKTNVTDKEAGGITQAIGAYMVRVNDRKVTFLDTPGHEAFTAMRMRGANSTDIAVLVVAADDGVMPQTVEAINHAKAAGVEIIVAVNKIDKPGANVDRVKTELSEYELTPVDWGGSTEFVPISAKTGQGIQDLLETILLTADIMELKANKNREARGLVIEAQLDKGRGPVATVLVQKGTLHVGDFVSAGASHGKVRAMMDEKGKRIKSAGPSTPVEILGLSAVPEAGDVLIAHKDDKTAKSYADTFIAEHKEKMLAETKQRMSLDDLYEQIKEGDLKELNIILKADVQGSVEALKDSLTKLSGDEVVVKVIHSGVGQVTESDVTLAGASNAIIIGFNVRIDAQAKMSAEREGVDVRLYNVIYQAIEDIEHAMKGMLAPVYEEKVTGHAEVRQIFHASAIGNIAGSYVLDGHIERGSKIRIYRGDEMVYEGALASLKRFKDDVKEVKEGYECGLVFDGFDKMQELDRVEAYIMVEVPRS